MLKVYAPGIAMHREAARVCRAARTTQACRANGSSQHCLAIIRNRQPHLNDGRHLFDVSLDEPLVCSQTGCAIICRYTTADSEEAESREGSVLFDPKRGDSSGAPQQIVKKAAT